jgi:hypothetical protein
VSEHEEEDNWAGNKTSRIHIPTTATNSGGGALCHFFGLSLPVLEMGEMDYNAAASLDGTQVCFPGVQQVSKLNFIVRE